jgi:hypothetical protein
MNEVLKCITNELRLVFCYFEVLTNYFLNWYTKPIWSTGDSCSYGWGPAEDFQGCHIVDGLVVVADQSTAG